MSPGRDRRFSSAATKLCCNASWNDVDVLGGLPGLYRLPVLVTQDFVGRAAGGSKACGVLGGARLTPDVRNPRLHGARLASGVRNWVGPTAAPSILLGKSQSRPSRAADRACRGT